MPEKIELTRVTDLNEGPEGELLKIDPEYDAYDIPPPPPAGAYAMKVYLGRDGYQVGEVDGEVFYVVPLELKIAEGPYEGRTVFARLDTRLYGGKPNHTLGTFLAKRLGPSKVPSSATPRQWVMLFDKFRKREPIVWGLLDWQAYSRDESAVVANGMTSFPRSANGGYVNFVRDKRGTLCYARPVITRWLSEDEFRRKPEVEDEEIPF